MGQPLYFLLLALQDAANEECDALAKGAPQGELDRLREQFVEALVKYQSARKAD